MPAEGSVTAPRPIAPSLSIAATNVETQTRGLFVILVVVAAGAAVILAAAWLVRRSRHRI